MSYRKPGPRVSATFVIYTLTVVALLALFPLYTNYKQAAAPLPPGVMLAGVAFPGVKDPAVMQARLAPIFAQPIGVRFEDQILVLDPSEIGFQVDFDATLAGAARYLDGFDFVDIAVREAIGLPQQPRDVPLRYTVDEARLRAWLQTAATQLDYAPLPPRVELPAVTLDATIAPALAAAATAQVTPTTATEAGAAAGTESSTESSTDTGLALPTATVAATVAATGSLTTTVQATTTVAATVTPRPIRKLTWLPGTPGQQLDVDASIPRIEAALASSSDRTAALALVAVPPDPPTLAQLAAQLPRVLDSFPVFTAVSVHDLSSHGSAQADGDAAFSGMTTMRVPLMAALMAALPNGIAAANPEAQQAGEWIDRMIGQGDDLAANQALAWLGNGDTAIGARRVTDFMRQAGMVNSFMQDGFGATAASPLLTPSNQRERPNTRPDPTMQTTPDDLAGLLDGIYACTLDQGKLRAAFPDQLLPQECEQMLFYLSHNELRDSLWRGLPDYEDQWIVHQQGLSYQQHGNVALVWGPAGPYTISIFIYNPSLTDSSTSNRAIADLSGMIWEFFEFVRAESQADPGQPPVLTPPPGYSPIDQYAPSVANPAGK